MKLRLEEDYYYWCCDWCDTENLVLWAKIDNGAFCGACHRPMMHADPYGMIPEHSAIAGGLC